VTRLTQLNIAIQVVLVVILVLIWLRLGEVQRSIGDTCAGLQEVAIELRGTPDPRFAAPSYPETVPFGCR
jgi:hypothetical protein